MSRQVQASIEIDAPVETVWDTIHDPAVYVEGIDWVHEAWWEGDGPNWTRQLRRAGQARQQGERLPEALRPA